ncbi:MAG: TIGR00282 family metallophosphoesterase [Candidatus Wallbacteria bacterium]|nr:TIGR00282 family metallophosphoesterase [Candidatus Wallbacteria bacterium]
MKIIKAVFLGDVDDDAGLRALAHIFPRIRKELNPDFIIVNGENTSKGLGLYPEDAEKIFTMGADAITMGNHTWVKREICPYIDKEPRLIRPINYPEGTPGKGVFLTTVKGCKAAVINALGRESIVNIFGKESFELLADPFTMVEQQVRSLREKGYRIIIVDFHAESGIEKKAFGYFLDGQVTAVLGTHTHVQTADAQIFEGGTAYITDCGMTGSLDSVVGVKKEEVISQYYSQMPVRFSGAEGDMAVCGVYFEIDAVTGKTILMRSFIERPEKLITSDDELRYLERVRDCSTLSSLSKETFEFFASFFSVPVAGGVVEWEKLLSDFVVRYLCDISGGRFQQLKDLLLDENDLQRLGGFARKKITDDEYIYFNLPVKDSPTWFVIAGEDLRLPEGLDRIVERFVRQHRRITETILLQQKVDEGSSLYEIGRVVSSTLELYGHDGLLDKIMALVTEVMNAEACSVILVDEKTNELYFEIGQGEKGEAIKQIRLKMGQGIAGWVAQNGKSCIVPDTSKDTRFFFQADDKTKFITRSIIAVPLLLKDKPVGVLEVLNKKGETTFNEHDVELLEAIASLAVNSIDNAKLYVSIRSLYKSTIQVLANAMDSKDPYTHGHSRRVAKYSVEIAKKIGLSREEIEDINFAALLHDIGKIGIRDHILCKPGRLTDEEYQIIKNHPVISAQILAPVEFLSDKIPMVRGHHERYDGKGYPDGLKGKDICLGARIIAVADSFDAMTSDRSYRKGMPFEQSFEELKKCSWTQFDGDMVDVFRQIYDEMKDTDLFNLALS